MAFDGSAIRALLDGAVAKGALHGIAALVVGRDGALFHHAAGEAKEHTLFRNASMTKAVATTGALQLVLPFFDMPVVETLMGFEMAVYQQVGAAVPAA